MTHSKIGKYINRSVGQGHCVPMLLTHLHFGIKTGHTALFLTITANTKRVSLPLTHLHLYKHFPLTLIPLCYHCIITYPETNNVFT